MRVLVRTGGIFTTSSMVRVGDDPACRPNQIISFSFAHPVLDRGRWESVLEVVQENF